MPYTVENESSDETDGLVPEGDDFTSKEVKYDETNEEELDINQMVREAKREYWEGKTTPLT